MRRVSSLQWKIIIFAVILVFLITIARPVVKGPAGVLANIASPVTTTFSSIRSGVSDFFSSFVLAEQIMKENTSLHQQVAQDQSKLAQLGEVQNENASLRQQLKLLPTLSNPVVAASVIGHDPTSLLEYVVIDKGSSDGIQNGAAVLSDGVLVGQCQNVSSHSAHVLLISDPHSSVDAIVQSSRASGIVIGTLGYGLSITQVPQNEPLSVGDSVISSGLGSNIPKGILIGTVASISSKQSDIFQSARLSSPVNFSRLETVYVVVPKTQ